MPGSNAAVIGAFCALTLFCAGNAGAQEIDGPIASQPFMLFVTPLLPPEGAERSEAFSNACFKGLKQFFDTTSFRAIRVSGLDQAISMSNQKKDIILTTDTLDAYLEGGEFDTLVVWLRYKVGLLHSRVDVPYPKKREATLPPIIAERVYRTIRNEFTGIAELEGGPDGMTILLVEGVYVKPPRVMLLPPGEYYITSMYPDFQPRLDTLAVFQGKTSHKRILLLP